MTRVVMLALVCAGSVSLLAQGGARQGSPDAAALGRGWTALAARQTAPAVEAAQQVLRTTPASHEAVSLLVAAQVTAGQPMPALDAYDTWVGASKHEDP